MNNLDNLYTQYGRMMIDNEILQRQINNIKNQISKELSKPKVNNEVVEGDK